MAHKELTQGVNSTEGSVVRGIVRFSLPYLLSYLLQTLYGMADPVSYTHLTLPTKIAV